MSQIRLLTLFAKIEFSGKFPNLQYNTSITWSRQYYFSAQHFDYTDELIIPIVENKSTEDAIQVSSFFTLENLCTRTAQSSRGVRSRRVHKIYYFGLL